MHCVIETYCPNTQLRCPQHMPKEPTRFDVTVLGSTLLKLKLKCRTCAHTWHTSLRDHLPCAAP